jgi:PEP-CTERM motif
MNILVDTINGTTLGSPFSQTATAGGLEFTQLSSPLFNPGITSMSGTATMNWGAGINPNQAAARSRVDFKIIAYDPPVRSSSVGTLDTPVSTPEPSALLGILGVLGLGWRGKKRKAD